MTFRSSPHSPIHPSGLTHRYEYGLSSKRSQSHHFWLQTEGQQADNERHGYLALWGLPNGGLEGYPE